MPVNDPAIRGMLWTEDFTLLAPFNGRNCAALVRAYYCSGLLLLLLFQFQQLDRIPAIDFVLHIFGQME